MQQQVQVQKQVLAGKKPRSTTLVKPTKNKNRKAALRWRIKEAQMSVDMTYIPKETFQKIVREIAREYDFNIRFQKRAVIILQEAVEAFMIDMFFSANQCAWHANRVTVTPKDMELVRFISGKPYIPELYEE